MAKEKKAFSETGFGKFLNKAKDVLPDVAGIALKAATGNISGAIEEASGLLKQNQTNKVAAQNLEVELRMHQMEWEREMREYDIKEMEVFAKDRDSARQREVGLAQTGKKDVMMKIVGFAVIALTVGVVGIVLFKSMDDFQQKVAIHVLGIVEGAFIGMVTYYFGSSQGSKDKQEKLDSLR